MVARGSSSRKRMRSDSSWKHSDYSQLSTDELSARLGMCASSRHSNSRRVWPLVKPVVDTVCFKKASAAASSSLCASSRRYVSRRVPRQPVVDTVCLEQASAAALSSLCASSRCYVSRRVPRQPVVDTVCFKQASAAASSSLFSSSRRYVSRRMLFQPVVDTVCFKKASATTSSSLCSSPWRYVSRRVPLQPAVDTVCLEQASAAASSSLCASSSRYLSLRVRLKPVVDTVCLEQASAAASSSLCASSRRYVSRRRVRPQPDSNLWQQGFLTIASSSSDKQSVPLYPSIFPAAECLTNSWSSSTNDGDDMPVLPEVLDIGFPEHTCSFCGAYFWYRERSIGSSRVSNVRYNLCCREGRVALPVLQDAPALLRNLLTPDGCPDSAHFHERIRAYNSLFSFVSFGSNIEDNINDGSGPYVFKIFGEVHHRIGSLLPVDGVPPCFAQLYVFDTANEARNRAAHFSRSVLEKQPKIELIEELGRMFDQHNILVKQFRNFRDRFGKGDLPALQIRIRADRDDENPQYCPPSSSEVVGFVVGDLTAHERSRDIIVEHCSRGLKRVKRDHPSLMALQYPIAFPYGEDGYHPRIRYVARTCTLEKVKIDREFVTMLEFYCFRLHPRRNEALTIFMSGRLFQQILVDWYTCVERERLYYIEHHQAEMRCDKLCNIRAAVTEGDMIGSDVGKRVVLPASHVGGPRYMLQNYHDAITLCSHFGPPDLFITFTCNPQWPEITRMLLPGQRPDERPDIVCRVFKMKYDELMLDIKQRAYFGKTEAVISQVEFQKRGLPHVHIIVWLAAHYKLKTPAHIDRVLSAEIPDPTRNPIGHKAVRKFMLHGPCGTTNDKSPCMKDGHCSKNFPKPFAHCTNISEDASIVYRRRDNNVCYDKAGVLISNAYVVPHNLGLIIKYQAHINVEKCYSPRLINYLFKWLCKGQDRQMIYMECEGVPTQGQSSSTTPKVNEVRQYLDCRCITPHQAAWRLFQYDLHQSYPSVERLPVHLPDENSITFHDAQQLQYVANTETFGRTKLTQWFVLNQSDNFARTLTYPEIPQKYVWDATNKNWTRRKKCHRLGRMYYVHPRKGELYYLRLLLVSTRGATSYEALRVINDVSYATFRDACKAASLLSDDDDEWVLAITDAASWSTSSQLRKLFIYILLHSEPADPVHLWNMVWQYLGDDIEHQQKAGQSHPNHSALDDVKKSRILEQLEQDLGAAGTSLSFYGLPLSSFGLADELENRLIREQVTLNRPGLAAQSETMRASLNSEQLTIYNAVMHSVDTEAGEIFFVYGRGGTGKTFLLQSIIAAVRSSGKIVLPVASSGIAALLLDGGTTAHSRFKIPINLSGEATCEIRQGTQLAKLIHRTSLIIWDEAPMNHKHCFEAVDRTLRDIMGTVSHEKRTKNFGGITVLFGGDFRQSLPVIPNAPRYETISSCITNSSIWKFCKLYRLHTNMRLLHPGMRQTDIDHAKSFGEWLLSVGDGTAPSRKLFGTDEANWIEIPPAMLLTPGSQSMNELISAVYSDFDWRHCLPQYLRERAIVVPTNEDADKINDIIAEMVPNDTFTYLSSDSMQESGTVSKELRDLYPPNYLNLLTPSGVPAHRLILKVGVPVMLLRNLDQSAGLCNGTRLIVTRLGTHLVEAEIISGHGSGKRTLIPRIIFIKKDVKCPFTMRRKQFPLRVCYAMTINKSQGQTLSTIGIYLPRPVFSHGQLYVALSRAKCMEGVKVLIVNPEDQHSSHTQNIVYKEVLSSLDGADSDA